MSFEYSDSIQRATRANKKMKQFYNITINNAGNWCGKCPDCNIVVAANDVTVSQIGIIASIERHRKEAHLV